MVTNRGPSSRGIPIRSVQHFSETAEIADGGPPDTNHRERYVSKRKNVRLHSKPLHLPIPGDTEPFLIDKY